MDNAVPSRPTSENKPLPGYIALPVPAETKERLTALVKPLYPVIKGEHVTLKLGAKNPSPETEAELAKFQNAKVEIYGVADDGRAVQCLLVRVNGEEKDVKGRPYHVTWSLDTNADVPAEYNGGKKVTKAKPMHAAYVAGIPAFSTRFAEVIPLQLSAQFYPEGKPAIAPAPAPRNC